MKKSPAFQFYPNDWLSSRDVRMMDAEQRGWFIQLLCEAWQSVPQCSLPDDPEILWKLAGASSKEHFNDRSNLVLTKFVSRSNLLWNDRLLLELTKQKKFREQRSIAGKHSAEKRKQTLTAVEISLNENRTEGQRDFNSSSSSSVFSLQTTSNKKEDALENKEIKYSKEFDEFWNMYPNRTGKGAAWSSWKKLNPSSELRDKIWSAIALQKSGDQWKKNNGEFIPHPSTWLNQARWDDEVKKTNGYQKPEFKPRPSYEDAMKQQREERK